MRLHVEIDQSGKIEATHVSSVLAYSGDVTASLLITAAEKRICLSKLRQGRSKGGSWYLKVFAAALYLLLQERLRQFEQIVIDVEYPGHEADILGMFLNCVRKEYPDFVKDRVVFRQVGKKSPAHEAAIAVYRGEREPDRWVRARDILRLIK